MLLFNFFRSDGLFIINLCLGTGVIHELEVILCITDWCIPGAKDIRQAKALFAVLKKRSCDLRIRLTLNSFEACLFEAFVDVRSDLMFGHESDGCGETPRCRNDFDVCGCGLGS
ncbi:hypothetical protein ACFOHJ_05395 [Aquamicrobium soli]|uniref:Uncharacterized protein n=1 Tax=Aquamicrobium soli TaxID=1811518 RepID=A0ABV7K5K5_9HYPH